MKMKNKVKTFGDWEVDETTGDIDNKKYQYDVPGNRLEEDNWIPHVTGKVWCNKRDFIDAYYHALHVKGIKDISFVKYVYK